MCCLWVYHTITTRWICYSYIFNIIILDLSTMFQAYNITSYDTSCDHSHISPYYLIKEIKSKKKNKNKNQKFKYTITRLDFM